MKHLAHIIVLVLALAASASAQTNLGLFYNTTNFTVLGFSNTNNLTFTNPVVVPVGSDVGTLVTTADDEVIVAGNVVLSGTTASLQLGPGTNFWNIQWEVGTTTNGAVIGGALDFANSTNKATTRTNLFGHGGITTNISVLVPGGGTNTLRFTNGLLFSNSVP